MSADETAERVYRVLSCPMEGDESVRSRLLRTIETTYAQGFVRRFLAAYADQLEARSTGLRSVVERWACAPTGFESVWANPWADVYGAACGGGDPVRAASGLALHLASTGVEGTWTAALLTPARLRWREYLLPRAAAISADHSCDLATLALALGDGSSATVAFARTNGSWMAEGAEALPALGQHEMPRLLAKEAIPLGCSFDRETSDAVVSSVDRETLCRFSAAFELVEAHAPAYSHWVHHVIHDIVVLRVPAGRMRSGSHATWPGVVYMSVADPIVLAENAVHEASHQYFHLLTRVAPVDDGSDTAHYFSPVVGRSRPLSAILVAYHAFANVSLFLSACARAGVSDGGYCALRLTELAPKLAALEVPVRGNPALTATGRALSEPLFERLSMGA